MARSKFSFIYDVFDILIRSYKVCRQYKILFVFYNIVLIMIALALIFAFLALVQTISPFVYPLF